VRPAADADPAQWLLRSGVDWWDLVRFGPPGLPVYVRVAFGPEGADPGEQDTLRTALATLAAHTTTPGSGYAAVWEGWGGAGPLPAAPRVEVPHRAMLLFAGGVANLRDAPSLAWYGSVQGYQEPHLVWPADQAWCVACEVDEELEFTVGCGEDAARALSRALPGLVRQVGYGAALRLYRDDDTSERSPCGLDGDATIDP
jgi:hypothetical protein